MGILWFLSCQAVLNCWSRYEIESTKANVQFQRRFKDTNIQPTLNALNLEITFKMFDVSVIMKLFELATYFPGWIKTWLKYSLYR